MSLSSFSLVYDYRKKAQAINSGKLSVMEQRNEACAGINLTKATVRNSGKRLNVWKAAKPEHADKIKQLAQQAGK